MPSSPARLQVSQAQPASSTAASPRVWGRHLNARFLAPFLDELEQQWGRPRLEAFLASRGAALPALREETAWLDFTFYQELMRDVAEATDMDFMARCAAAITSPRYLGAAHLLFRVLGSPGALYRALPSTGRRLNQVSQVDCIRQGRGRVQLRYGVVPPEREIHPVTCFLRRHNLVAVPRLWGLPDAHVQEVECMHQGAPSCTYDIRYPERIPLATPVLSALAGGVLGVLVPAPLAPALLGVLLASSGGLLGALWEGRRSGRVMAAQQVRNLEALLRDSELRFAQLSDEVAQHQRTEQEAQRLAEQVRRHERMAGMGTVAAVIAHEINNPLAAVLANLSYLAPALQDAGAEQLEALQDAVHCAERIRSVVLQLELAARPTRGPPAAVDLAQVAQSAATLVAPELRARAELVHQVDPHHLVDGDEGRLCQVVVNFLANSFQAMDPAAPARGRVLVRVADREDQVVCLVQDTGRGIASQHLQAVFHPFFTTQPAGTGAGLGLAMSQGIAAEHGGRIEVHSVPGQGSTFTLVLPALPERAP